NIFGVIAIVFFLLLTFAYLFKLWKYPLAVKAEFNHPVSISFFGTFIISLLLLPGFIYPYFSKVAILVWIVGAVLMFVFAWVVLRKWFGQQQDPANALPAWIIPVVGTLDVPIVGSQFPIPGIHEICLAFFGIGIVFTIILVTLILSRLLFHPPLPEAVQPTLLILIGPFALACSSYELLTGVQDMTASIFYYFGLFLLLLFGTKVLLISKCCPFRVTWWAVSFPLVAITIASFRYASHKQSFAFQIIPALLLIVSTATILFLLIQTFYRLFSKKLFLLNPVSEKATQIMFPITKP
ncbi:MAG: SLAC1 anion channel family protein, partial [Ferruginibacter sp.]